MNKKQYEAIFELSPIPQVIIWCEAGVSSARIVEANSNTVARSYFEPNQSDEETLLLERINFNGYELNRLLYQVLTSRKNMGQLIDDLLKLSRISRSNIEREDIDIGNLAKDIFDELTDDSKVQNVRLKVEGGMSANADRRLIRILLTNLISNALKFSAGEKQHVIETGSVWVNENKAFYIKNNKKTKRIPVVIFTSSQEEEDIIKGYDYGAELNISDLPVIKAATSSLEQIFQNLIGNALKYRHPTSSGKVSFTVLNLMNHQKTVD